LKILKRLYLCFTSLLIDRLVVGLLSEIAFRIGRDAAILIQLLNPQTIILSGRGSIAGKIWQAPIQRSINEYCIPSLARNAQIIISSLGYTSRRQVFNTASKINPYKPI
jgi:predicted NBD/HSP70 family sugar kinase